MSPKILALSGSLRTDSFNQRLVRLAARMAEANGSAVTVISLREFDLPLFDEDLERERGLPDDAVRLKDLFKAHHGFLIACPEYNSSITPALKNAIDWVSRPRQGERPLECFAGKVAGLCAASPGVLGGLRGLYHVREILCNIGVHVVPKLLAVNAAHESLADDAGLSDPHRGRLESMVRQLCDTCGALHPN